MTARPIAIVATLADALAAGLAMLDHPDRYRSPDGFCTLRASASDGEAFLVEGRPRRAADVEIKAELSPNGLELRATFDADLDAAPEDASTVQIVVWSPSWSRARMLVRQLEAELCPNPRPED